MRPARQCRCPKASFAAPAGRPIPKVGNAALTAVSTRCGPVRMDRSASSCSGSCRSSSSGPGRRMSAAPARAGDVLRAPTPGRNNSSASADAMVALNAHRAGADPNRSVLLSSSGRPSNRRPLRKPRGSGRGAVAAVVAEVADQKNPLLRIRAPHRSSRGLRASRVHPVRRRRHVRIRRSRAKKGPRLAPRAMVPNDGDASAAGGVGVGRKAARRPRKLHQSPTYVVSKLAVAVACATTFGRLSWRCRAVHSAKPSQRMQ